MGNPEIESEVREPEMSDEELQEQHLIAQELRRLREECGLTRAELSEQMGEAFTEELIAQYEIGDTPMKATLVLALMKTLNASPDSLYPNRLLAARLIRNGYGELSSERRKDVDLLTAALAEDQRKELSNGCGTE